jgi:hypothetical protein
VRAVSKETLSDLRNEICEVFKLRMIEASGNVFLESELPNTYGGEQADRYFGALPLR